MQLLHVWGCDSDCILKIFEILFPSVKDVLLWLGFRMSTRLQMCSLLREIDFLFKRFPD